MIGVVKLYVGPGEAVDAIYWSDGPADRPGTKWFTIKVVDRNRHVLAKIAPRTHPLSGKWIPVER